MTQTTVEPDEWHVKMPEYPMPTLPPSQEILNTVSRWLSKKTGPEIHQALSALLTMAKEHRQAGRFEQAEKVEAHIPPLRLYIKNVLPKRTEQIRGTHSE